MERPNIVLITAHDLGDFLGCYNTQAISPNIDDMAARGVVFENHFSTSTVCSPARGSIVTGCYPHTHGLMGLVHRGWTLNVDKCRPLPSILQEYGYDTHLFGFQHEHIDPCYLGYSHIHEIPSIECEKVSEAFVKWIKDSGNKTTQPFFAGIGFSETHRIGLPSHFKRDVYSPLDSDKIEVPPYLPDVPEIREELADFYGAVNWMDRSIGEMLNALEKGGVLHNTLVILLSDHGASFPHAKGTLYDGGTKVACIMSWPHGFPSGHRVRALTSHVDILPTILDVLGIPIPRNVQGESCLDLIRDRKQSIREYVFAENNYTNYYDPARMVRSANYKYIKKGLRTCVFDFVIPELEQCSSSFRRNEKTFNFYSAERCYEELYDLEKDPGELKNRAKHADYRNVLDELKRVLYRHLDNTDDPFKDIVNDLPMPADGYVMLQKHKAKQN